MNKIWQLVMLTFIIVMLAACGGDGDDESNETSSTPAPVNAIPTVDFSLLGDPISSMRVPRGLRTNGNLTVVDKSEFVRDGVLYLAYVVRNDSDEVKESVKAVVQLVDAEDFFLASLNLSSPATHIPPSGLAVLQRSFNLANYPEFDGLAVTIVPDVIISELEINAYPTVVEAAWDVAADKLEAQVSNEHGLPLQTPVAHFLVYDAEGSLLNAIPATLSEALPTEGWLPNTSITYTAKIPPLPDQAEVQIGRVDLLVYGYEYSTQ